MNLLRIYIDRAHVGVEVSWYLGAFVVVIFLFLTWWHFIRKEQPLQQVEMSVNLAQLATVKICPTWEDIQVAHKIWTELVTRKAAIPLDLDHDVLAEVYDSWYALFQRVRQLIAEIPARSVRRCESTQQLVTIATETLNKGLRPHLTRWHAEYRNWWEQNKQRLADTTPQSLQLEFPQYRALVADMQRVNVLLIEYAQQLRKLVHGTPKPAWWQFGKNRAAKKAAP